MTENIIRTISIKLDVNGHDSVLQETQKRFNAAASWIAAVCWEEHITNTNTAHHRVYAETRSHFALSSQLAITARAKAVEAIAATTSHKNATCPQFTARGSVRYDARSFSLKTLNQVSLLTVAGRVRCHLMPGQRQYRMLTDREWTMGGADLVWRRGVYYLNITQHKEKPAQRETPDTLGVDLGIVNLATDSEGEFFSGAQVHEVRMRYQKRRQTLQKIGTRSAKRRLKQMSGREKRFQKDTNHHIAKALVDKAVRTRKAIALEDLTGIRERVSVRRVNRYERHAWAFSQLRGFISYKAAWAGVAIKVIDPRNTSRTCSQCGYCAQANRHSQASFRCQQCGFCCHADYNAAINISRSPVKRPMVAGRAWLQAPAFRHGVT